MKIEKFRKIFNKKLEKEIAQRLKLYSELSKNNSLIEEITSYVPLLCSQGKRIRPYVALTMYEVLGGKKIEDIFNFLISIELLHLSFLVHDDIMDGAERRHGIPSATAYLSKRIFVGQTPKRKERLSLAHSILLGDFLFFCSSDVLLKDDHFSADQRSLINQYYTKMIGETILGQMVDVNDETIVSGHPTTLTLDTKAILKTGKYSFVRPLEIGVALSDAKKNLSTFCLTLGSHLGIAFQAHDDLLDAIGLPEQTGKPRFVDIRMGKQTYLTQSIFLSKSKSDRRALRLWTKRTEKVLSKKNERALFLFLKSTGALETCHQVLIQHKNSAHFTVDDSVLFTTSQKRKLHTLIKTILPTVMLF